VMDDLGYFDYCVPLNGRSIVIGGKYEINCGSSAQDSRVTIDGSEMAGITRVEIIIDASIDGIPVMKIRLHGDTIDKMGKHFWRRE